MVLEDLIGQFLYGDKEKKEAAETSEATNK